MGFRDLLLPIFTYPDTTPTTALETGVAIADRLGARLTALALRVRIDAPRSRLANILIQYDEMIRQCEADSDTHAHATLATVRAAADRLNVACEALSIQISLYGEADLIGSAARTHDLCLMSIGPAVLAELSVVEAVLFASGRPVLIFPEAIDVKAPASFDTVVVAWDGSRAAARAVADALPLLVLAKHVFVFTALNEKPSAKAGSTMDLVRHLALHNVRAAADEIELGGRRTDVVLADYLRDRSADLLVMGAFAHSRAREFVLGGVTSSVLHTPTIPVFMSH